jgi:hypothetical protein
MPTTVEQLAEQAMTLPSESRARLADLLVKSLEGAEPWSNRATVDHRGETPTR